MSLPLLANSRGVHGETVGGTRFFGDITIPALREVYRGCHRVEDQRPWGELEATRGL